MPHYKVLLIEPDPLARVYFSRLLTEHFATDTASQKESALELITSRGPYAVFVLDLASLEQEGADFLSRLELENPDVVTVLICDPATMAPDRLSSLQARAFRILSRDCSPAALVRTIRQAIEHHQGGGPGHDPHQVLSQEEKKFFALLAGATAASGPANGAAATDGLDVGDGMHSAFPPFDSRNMFRKTLAQAKRSSIPLGVLTVGPVRSTPQAEEAVSDSSSFPDSSSFIDAFQAQLLSRLRQADSLWRFNSEELTVLLWNVSGPEGLEKVAADILKIHADLVRQAQVPADRLDVRIGASLFPQHGEDADALIEKAARAKLSVKTGKVWSFRLSAA